MITEAFTKAAEIRARVLGMTDHPVVVIGHPIASKSKELILALARNSVAEVSRGLISGSQEPQGG